MIPANAYPLLLQLAAGGGEKKILNSLRFRANGASYLSRTFAAVGNQQKFTFQANLKRGSIGASNQSLFGSAIDTSNYFILRFNVNSQIQIVCAVSAAVVMDVSSSAVFRDPASHCSVTLSVDTAQAVAADRVKFFLGNTQVPLSGTLPAQNANLLVWTYRAIGNILSNFFDGYMSDVYFIDGQALTPDNFGKFNASGVWGPKAYTGTFGTNGFYLPFNDGSSLTTLGADRSGNNNNFSLNNFSLAADASYSWMADTPSNNFPTWNPLNNDLTQSNMGNGNLTAYTDAAGWAQSTMQLPTTGKYYAELLLGSSTDASAWVAVRQPNASAYLLYQRNGFIQNLGGVIANVATYAGADTIGIAVDCAAGTVQFYKNNVLQYSGATTVIGATIAVNAINSVWEFNAGQRPFTYTPPTGYTPWSTQSLPDPAIKKPAQNFDILLWTGDGATPKSRTGLLFPPDFMWVKQRGGTANHAWFDVVRGTGAKMLVSNQAVLEHGDGAIIDSFDSAGFTTSVGTTNHSYTNTSGVTYAGFGWKGGGASVANNAGSIASQVSANIAAGFSVVTYTGTGVNATVGHGIGIAPRLILTYRRNVSAIDHMIYHESMGNTKVMYLNLNNAPDTTGAVWNSTSPTSSVFSLGTHASVNPNGGTMVAYCFAEVPGYSKIASYVGNGSADGPFVYCGFSPRWILIKDTITGGNNWIEIDTARTPFNTDTNPFTVNTNNAESPNAVFAIDRVSNGFKIRNSNSNYNTNGSTYIFMAIAEQPFKTANAR